MLNNLIERGNYMELDEAFEKILLWKAKRMLSENRFQPIGVEPSDAVKRASIDAMVFDMASITGFTRETGEHSNWAAFKKRREFLDKVFKSNEHSTSSQ